MSGATGEKTEKPTPKRLREARKKGQIPKSVDLTQWITLLAASFVIPAVVTGMGARLERLTHALLKAATTNRSEPILAELDGIVISIFSGIGPLFALAALVIIVTLASQGGVVLAGEQIKPKAERISPKAGLKRLFSTQPLVETGKAMIRLAVLGIVGMTLVRAMVGEHLVSVPRALDATLLRFGQQLLLLLRVSAAAGVVVGIADYAYQRYRTNKKLKMSKQEIKQEFKQSEGDPQIKGRRRQAHAQLSHNQLLAAVDEASAVIVNPTHVAVAIHYAEGTGAPRVVAKGGDELALRIRERAWAKGVAVVEARPLARVLHDRVKIGEEIPEELFRAIAIVLAFVMQHPPRGTADAVVRRVAIPASAMRLSDPTPNRLGPKAHTRGPRSDSRQDRRRTVSARRG